MYSSNILKGNILTKKQITLFQNQEILTILIQLGTPFYHKSKGGLKIWFNLIPSGKFYALQHFFKQNNSKFKGLIARKNLTHSKNWNKAV